MTLAKAWNIRSYGWSDIGLSRHKNEDAWAQDLSCQLYALADGIGGRQAGEVASQYAVKKICQIIAQSCSQGQLWSREQVKSMLAQSIEQTNSGLLHLAQQNEFLHGMGTTLCCLMIYENMAYIAHLGDSRIYLMRKGQLLQLTQDHKPCSRRASNYITKALGLHGSAQPCTQQHSIDEDDLFLLCSDGLSNALSHEQIERILLEKACLKRCTHALINCAKRSSGNDNITALLVHLSP